MEKVAEESTVTAGHPVVAICLLPARGSSLLTGWRRDWRRQDRQRSNGRMLGRFWSCNAAQGSINISIVYEASTSKGVYELVGATQNFHNVSTSAAVCLERQEG
ncbi:MAG: hypothetical protein C0404_05610 [Verrucomicrobia bacterium]|nr:hypothetical protein [Verrucomicrobiota bacterium]